MKRFREKYPYVKLEVYRADSADLARRTRRVSLNMEGGLLAPLSMAERVTLARLLARLADKQGDGRAA